MSFIYFDNNATTPVRPEVLEALRPFLTPGGEFGNPSSLHTTGQRARAALETARERVAGLLGAADPEVIVAAMHDQFLLVAGLIFCGLVIALLTWRWEHQRGLRKADAAAKEAAITETATMEALAGE